MGKIACAFVIAIGLVMSWACVRVLSWWLLSYRGGLPNCPCPPVPPVKPPKDSKGMVHWCWNCGYWRRDDDIKDPATTRVRPKSDCRRSPPVVLPRVRVHNPCGPSGPSISTEWPQTRSVDCCGEWRMRDETEGGRPIDDKA